MVVNEIQRTINGLGSPGRTSSTIIPYGHWMPFQPGAIARGPGFGDVQHPKDFVGRMYDLFRSGTTDLRFQRDAACTSGPDGQPVDRTACSQLNTNYTAAVDQATKRMMYAGIAVAVVAGVGTTALVVRARRRKKGGR